MNQLYKIYVDGAPSQVQTFDFFSNQIQLTLNYNALAKMWLMNVYEPLNNKEIIQGAAVVTGVPMLLRTAQNYYFYCEDSTGAQSDPSELNDFINQHVLYIGVKP